MNPYQLPSGQPGRRRRPWALPLLLILLIAVPMAEIWVLLQVGNWIGLLPTIGLLLVIAVFGTWLSRREGGRAWKGIHQALETGELPGGRIADAAMILLGAILLVFPGFLTDIVALLFLLPLTRPLMRRILGWSIARQAKKYAPEAGPGMIPPFGVPGYPPAQPRPEDRPQPNHAQGDIIEGQVVDQDPDESR